MNEAKLREFYQNLDRSVFIDNELKEYAKEDSPLPIGYEQTISQPSLVLEMTRLLSLDKNCKVLEIGTGSGYQTAFLAEFAEAVYTVERIPELLEKAKVRLGLLGYINIHFNVADGSTGWRENEPYDRIIVTAAAEEIPEELINQLKSGGRMIIPVGPQGSQSLTLITKDHQGETRSEKIFSVVFVELKGRYGWSANDQT